MKNQKLFKTLAFALIVVVLAITMSACMKEEDYYTKSDVESLIDALETKILDNKTELDVKIDGLKAEYEAKVTELQKTNFDNKTAIEALKAEYTAKVTELEASDKANADALATLKAEYQAKVTELQKADTDNKAAIEALEAEYAAKVTELEASDKANADALATLKAEYQAKVAELNGLISANSMKIVALETELNGKIADAKADYEAKISGISELITALQNADTENVKKVAALEAKVEEILARHEHSFGEWFDFENNDDVFCENRVFYHACEECNIMELKRGSYENHKFVTVTTPPTCVSGGYDTKTCEICGKTETLNETPTTDHTWKTEYSNDNSFHWFDCEYCDADNAKAEHDIDESGHCTVCQAPLAPSEGIMYDLSADKTYADVIGYTGTATKINIASEYNGVPVKSICSEAFKNSKITSVVIPDSVESIGAAFEYCGGLTSVIIPNSVKSIGFAAFRGCGGLTSVVIPDSVTSIGGSAFFGCSGLASVIIPDGVTYIGDSAFAYCSRLTSVVIPNSVTSIGADAFSRCSSLTSVVIEDSVSIGDSAFSGCNSKLYTEYEYGKYVGSPQNPYAILIEVTNNNLSTYNIHESTKIISYGVFSSCKRLTSITIPDSVTSIGSYAFSYCFSLTSVVLGDSVTSIGSKAFSDCYYLKSIVIPDSVRSIGSYAFLDYSFSSGLNDVYYTGTEEQWHNIIIDPGNDGLTGATKHFNYVKEG